MKKKHVVYSVFVQGARGIEQLLYSSGKTERCVWRKQKYIIRQCKMSPVSVVIVLFYLNALITDNPRVIYVSVIGIVLFMVHLFILFRVLICV